MIDQTKNPTTLTITPDIDSAKNNYNLGPGSDTPPGGLVNQGFGAEIVWNIDDLLASGAILPGHTYRLQFMVHDGDQNKTGGDVGEACTTVFSSAPTATPTNTRVPDNTPTPTPTNTPIPVGNLCVLEWHDLNGNGLRDGSPLEPLLNNAAISVYNQSSGMLIGSWVTNGTEPHCYNNLPPGPYLVTDMPPSGYTATTPIIYNAQVFANQTTQVDFGAWVPPTATPTPTPTRFNAPTNTPTVTPVPGCVMGTKQNNVGQYLSSWVITASWTDPVSGNPQTRTATTDVNGQYVFNNLTPGLLYTISEVMQPGWNSVDSIILDDVCQSGTAVCLCAVRQPAAADGDPDTDARQCADGYTDEYTDTRAGLCDGHQAK